MNRDLLLVDAHHHIYRAFHAITVFTGPSREPVNAVYGFLRMLKKWMTDFRPSHAAAVFDGGISAKRRAALASYKGGRLPKPAEMENQIPLVKEVLQAMGVTTVESPGEEADDLIATLADRAVRQGLNVLVASNDKDYAQLVGPHVKWIRAERNETVVIDQTGVKARFGVEAGQIVDFMCLTGDKVDNIPGVPGIGEKTAADLINRFGTIEALIARMGEIERPKLRDAVSRHVELIRGNRVLVTLQREVHIPNGPEHLQLRERDCERLGQFFRTHGLKTLLEEFEREKGQTPDLFGGF